MYQLRDANRFFTQKSDGKDAKRHKNELDIQKGNSSQYKD